MMLAPSGVHMSIRLADGVGKQMFGGESQVSNAGQDD
jgi:hypothetical protein